MNTSLNRSLAAFGVGLLFALGLGISGMTQVGKVIGFLDIFGSWQAALVFVMGGAILVHAIAYQLIRKQPRPAFDPAFHIPEKKRIDLPLLGGALVFGLGWGMGGFCPGPALVSLASGQPRPWIFTLSMIAGMLLVRVGAFLKPSPTGAEKRGSEFTSGR